MLWSDETLERIYLIIGERIRIRRNELGYSQTQLGKKVSLTRSSIANIEAGRQRPMIHTVMQIANELGMEPRDFLPEVEQPQRPMSLETGSLDGQPESTQNFVQRVIQQARR